MQMPARSAPEEAPVTVPEIEAPATMAASMFAVVSPAVTVTGVAASWEEAPSYHWVTSRLPLPQKENFTVNEPATRPVIL